MDVPDAKPGQGENHLSLIIEQTINQKKGNRYSSWDGEIGEAGAALVMLLLFPCVNPSAGTVLCTHNSLHYQCADVSDP